MNNNNEDRIFGMLDRLDIRLDGMERILVIQEVNLKEHIRRNDNFEVMLDLYKKDLDERVTPLENDRQFRKELSKLAVATVGIVATVVAILAGIAEIMSQI